MRQINKSKYIKKLPILNGRKLTKICLAIGCMAVVGGLFRYRDNKKNI